jgi:hypothetical protein
MSLPEFEIKKIERAMSVFMQKRRPPISIRSKLDLGYRIAGQSVTLFEIRPQWNDLSLFRESPVAKAVYVRKKNIWKIYWMRADLKWHGYYPVPEVASIDEFLDVVDEDEDACFWG